MTMNSFPIWLLIDISSWAHPDLHATGSVKFALNNIIRRVEACKEKFRPERIVFCFDSQESFRKKLAPGYKANRDKDPLAGLHSLLELIVEYAIENMHDYVKIEGFEADDIIATLASLGIELGRKSVMVSGDKDLHQCLVPGWVNQVKKVRYVRQGEPPEFEILTADGLIESTGLQPCQWVDYQSMVGDATDNVSGCESIGEKMAKELLRVWSSLDDYFADPNRTFKSKLSANHHRKLAAFRTDGLDRSRRLVTLRNDVPVPAAWHEVCA